ncbi:S-adenosyl-L-methionine-dependent methyltransferase, partial [Hesseltinella vesiculosa]
MGTGTGQGATKLAQAFQHVAAFDRSPDMIANATPMANVTYKVAEDTDLEKEMGPNSLDMVTVATAFHWFDHRAFFPLLKRVLKPNGTFATWTYYLPLIKDQPVANAYLQQQWTSGPLVTHSDPRLQHVINLYRDYDFPFRTVQYYISPLDQDTTNVSHPHALAMEKSFSLLHFADYLKTASGYLNWKSDPANRDCHDPVDAIVNHLSDLLHISVHDPVHFQWPLVLVLCR